MLGLAAGAQAAGRPSLGEPGISPNGRDIAFVSGGNVWTVNANGGAARLLIADDSTKERPLYSPDGSKLAFISQKTGNGDIYVLTLATGAVARITYNDNYDQLDGWSRDGFIYFSSPNGNVQGERDEYRVRATGGTPLPIVSETYVGEFYGAPSPDGQSIAFDARGFSVNQWWRVGHSHLDESEIWIKHGTGNHPTYERVTDGGAKEVWPMWAPGGRSLYYMSDRSGAQNIWERPLGGGSAREVTHFTGGRVVWPSIASDGRTIVFERDFGIWKVDSRTGRASRVPIVLQGAISEPGVKHVAMTNHYTDYRISPDGKKLAFIVHGRLFAVATPGGSAFEVTHANEYARELTWAPDSNAVAFASGSGHEDRLYTYDFVHDSRRELTTAPADVRYLTYDPAAKAGDERLAYEQSGAQLRILDVATKHVRTLASGNLPLTPGEPDRALVWSPDGRWIAYFDTDSRSFTNVRVVDVETGRAQPISFLSNAYANTVSWSPDGKYILFDSGQRTEPQQLARVDLVPYTPTFAEDRFHKLFTPNGSDAAPAPAASRAPASSRKHEEVRPSPVRVAFDGIHDRLDYLPTGLDVNSQVISPDGKSVLLTAVAAGQQNLYLYSLNRDSKRPDVPRQITSNAGGKAYAQWAPDGKAVYYLDDDGAIQSVSLQNFRAAQVPIAAEFDEDWNRDKVEDFTEAWSAIRDFYADPHTNGVNWAAVHAKYAAQFEGAQNPDEMRRLLQLMIGELDSSHTGVYAPPGGNQRTTGHLGLSFDRVAYERDGILRVTEVVARSPVATAGGVRVGDDLLAVDGVRVDGRTNLDQLLDNTTGKKVTLTIRSAGRTHVVPVKPVNYSSISNLRYRAWVAANRDYVDRASGGRLGYVHIPDMEPASLAQFYKDLDTIEFSKQGVVIDIRSNEGGFVNAYALDVLSRRPYLLFTSRNSPTSPAREVLGQRALEKPTVLMVNEETLSDGEDFTQGYEAMHLGTVVGEPTAGWIIYTSAIQLIDGTIFRLPSTRVTTLSGQPMELHPRPVDIHVQRAIGTDRDAQLQTAVRTLLDALPSH
ncbi:MAG TPA: S41 family peptidase [Candidatus Baltobacteraceae bacterium]